MPIPITRRPRWRHARAALSCLWIAGAAPALSGLVTPGDAHATTTLNSPAPDLNASARAEVAQALFAASATSAATERAADAKLTQQRRQIEQLQTQLKTAGGRNATLLADLTRAQERFVEQLAERDRAYAQSIAVFRRAVQDIAATPEGEAALRQFNAGDEAGALAVLDRMVDARERARKVQADIETAVERRRVATLALEAMGKGKQQAVDVIRRFEEVTRLDPGVHWDWVELARLYVTVGRLPDARHAAQQAVETAGNDRDRAVALSELGDVLVEQGNLAAASEKYRDASDMLRKRVAAELTNAGMPRDDLSISLDRLGDVLVAQGDLVAARARFEEGLDLTRKLAAADPTSASLQRKLNVSRIKLGDVLIAQGDLIAARAMVAEGVDIARGLVAADPTSVRLGRDLSVSLDMLGATLAAQGDLDGARSNFQEGLGIARELAAADPTSATLQRELTVSLERLGDLEMAQRDLAGARWRFQEVFERRSKLAVMDPTSATLQRDLIVGHIKLGGVQLAQGDLMAARVMFEEGLDIARKLVMADPISASAQRDLFVILIMLGNVQVEQGDLIMARVTFEAGLDIARRLATADVTSASLQRDLIVSYVKLSDVFKDRRYAQQALDVALAMQQRGILAPRDAWMVEDLKRRAGP